MIGDLLGLAPLAQDARGVVVAGGEPADVLGAHRAAGRRRLVGVERVLEAAARRVEHQRDLAGQRARLVELAHRVGIGRVRRIVDQQHDADVRELLQRRREQRLADDPALLLVGGDDRGQRRVRHVEERVDDRARHAPVRADPLQVAEPREQVGDGRQRQERDEQQVDARLDRAAQAVGMVDVAAHLLDEVGEPGRDRQEEREARTAHRAARRDRVHDRGRPGGALGPPLTPHLLRLVSGRAGRAPADPHVLPRGSSASPRERGARVR